MIGCSWQSSIAILCVALTGGFLAHGEEAPVCGDVINKTSLVLACDEKNDLLAALIAGGVHPKRFDAAGEAVEAAGRDSTVLVLADAYPEQRTAVDAVVFDAARSKGITLYVEFPEFVPGVTFDAPQGVRWERGIVAKNEPDLGLSSLRMLALHDFQYFPTKPA